MLTQRAKYTRLTFCVALAVALVGRAALGEEPSSYEQAADRLVNATVTLRITGLAAAKTTLASDAATATSGQPAIAQPATADEVTVCSGVVVAKQRIVTFVGDRDAKAGKFRVTLPGGDQATGELRVVDHYSGLALLKIAAAETAVLEAAAETPKIGGALLTAAAAGIDAPSVSAGILSATDRSLSAADLPPLLQCDLRTTETSSGAAVVDRQGKLVGIVVASAGSTARSAWTYAAPVAHVQRLLAAEKPGQVIELTRRRPAVGFTLGPGDKDGLVQVERVEQGPAAEAGIQKGDVIVEADGRRIRSAYQAVNRILAKQPGDKLSLLVERDGRRQHIELTLGAGNAAAETAVAGPSPIVRVGPQLSVSTLGGNRIAVQNGQTEDVAVDPSAHARHVPTSEVEMLRVQVDAFEKIIRRLESELDARTKFEADTEEHVRALREEISQLKKQSDK